jgi:translation initiation factor 2B subunit (eIF-2B alpha/beta/delta family)
MTEWREWVAWRRIVRVADDPIESAAAVGVDAARALKELAQTVAALAPEAYPEAVLDGAELLNERRQGMAPIANLRNIVYLTAVEGIDRLIAALDEYVEHIIDASDQLAKVGADLISDAGTVLVHAHSTSVRAVLDAARSKGKWFTVSCTEALPTGEGAEMASELASAGYQVELLGDETASEVIGGMDVVLAGAEALGPGSAINKVGTGELATAARRGGVPIYLVASTGKVLPPTLFDDAARLTGRMGLSEVLPLHAVTGVITEMGVLSPEEVSGLANRGTVAPELP